MAETPIKCYTDASFDPVTRIAVCGWKINNSKTHTFILRQTNNTRAEIISLIDLIENLNANSHYVIFTDCEGIIKRVQSKNKLVEKIFCNRKGKELNNADLYKKLFEILTSNITLEHIEGHIPTGNMNEDNRNFSELDKYLRSELRSLFIKKN